MAGGESNGGDTASGGASAFRGSGKVLRSPVLNQAAASSQQIGVIGGETPKSSVLNFAGGTPQDGVLLGRTALQEVRRRVNELFEFIKDRNNVHTRIKQMVNGVKAAMIAAERENSSLVVTRTSLKLRAERAVEALEAKLEEEAERNKGEALVVEVKEGVSYADLLGKVRTDPELEELGENVVKTRRTQTGAMLFELKNDPAVKSSAFKSLVEKAVGYESKVRALLPETTIECRNLDKITTEEELEDALIVLLDDRTTPMAIRLRKAYGGTQIASIRLSTPAASKLLEAGKVKMVSNHKKVQQAQIHVGEHVVHSKRALKYLGVMVDDRLNFNSHVDYACEKAAKAIMALSRIMPNNAGPRSSRRRLLASVATSILRYGGPVWWTALGTKRNRALLDRTQRLMAIRVASAYRTISSEAVGVIAGMIPIGITLEEDTVRYTRRGTRGIREAARAESLARWQREWDTTEKGRWTHRLIPSVSTWVSRRHGEVTFHLTQFLSGHGCFRKYLHRFGHAESPLCSDCVDCEKTPEHVVFGCPRFEAARSEMLAIIGADTSSDNVMQRMCSDIAKWNAVVGAVTQITSALQRKWRDDQRRND
ncbi:uncharacterized protein LOC128092324 [Culex pipiens pallens]|uniref:uncharacterized protein LOC128092324 n=1 Tax=Culex pipiens pallens TaxID=42434 RepID=UPI0022AA315E|nr:uncharacterized protein LOC128092324 [Culex pipiens pallens]